MLIQLRGSRQPILKDFKWIGRHKFSLGLKYHILIRRLTGLIIKLIATKKRSAEVRKNNLGPDKDPVTRTKEIVDDHRQVHRIECCIVLRHRGVSIALSARKQGQVLCVQLINGICRQKSKRILKIGSFRVWTKEIGQVKLEKALVKMQRVVLVLGKGHKIALSDRSCEWKGLRIAIQRIDLRLRVKKAFEITAIGIGRRIERH